MSTGIIIQARSHSTRLPGKLTLPFYRELGILELLMDRIRTTLPAVPVVLATTVHAADDPLAEIGEKLGAAVFRGSEDNVLERFLLAARAHDLDKIVRVCSDNPFLDMKALETLVGRMQSSTHDYWCFSTGDGLPTIKTHYGFWAEGVSRTALQRVQELTAEKAYQEHVTNYIYTYPGQFDIASWPIDPLIDRERSIRLTVDTRSDFQLAGEIYASAVREGIALEAGPLVGFITQHPEWMQVMQNEIHSNTK